MQKHIFISFISGVLYAAFLQSDTILPPFLLLFSLFLPVLLFIPAILQGTIGVLIASFPVLISVFFIKNQSLYPILTTSIFPALIVGYVFYDRFRFKQKEGFIFGIQAAVEIVTYLQILFLSLLLLFPKTWEILAIFIENLQSIISNMKQLNHQVSIGQFSLILPMGYIFLNIYCLRLSLLILKTLNYPFNELEKNYAYSPWIDIPVLFFLLLQTLFEAMQMKESVLFIINAFLILSLWPVLNLGIQVFKTIGNYYGFSKRSVNISLFVVFFLVHPLIFIVILGLMESSSSITQRFRRKHF